MDNKELKTLLEIADSFAKKTYKELFNTHPDTSKEGTRLLLEALQQAWLTGYAYLRIDPQLDNAIEEIFGFFVESIY